jgi:hypothetical protein
MINNNTTPINAKLFVPKPIRTFPKITDSMIAVTIVVETDLFINPILKEIKPIELSAKIKMAILIICEETIPIVILPPMIGTMLSVKKNKTFGMSVDSKKPSVINPVTKIIFAMNIFVLDIG